MAALLINCGWIIHARAKAQLTLPAVIRAGGRGKSCIQTLQNAPIRDRFSFGYSPPEARAANHKGNLPNRSS